MVASYGSSAAYFLKKKKGSCAIKLIQNRNQGHGQLNDLPFPYIVYKINYMIDVGVGNDFKFQNSLTDY